jgi:hypothetical protein
MLRARNLVVALRNSRLAALELRLQFRNFQNSQGLALTHLIAYIDIDGANEAGNLGMNIDHLVGLELSRQAQGPRNRSSLNAGYRGRWDIRAGCLSAFRPGIAPFHSRQCNQHQARGEKALHCLSHSEMHLI